MAPFILQEQWAVDSAAAKTLLRTFSVVSLIIFVEIFLAAEDKYLLKDAANESKYNFNLSASLKRAKAAKTKLFANHMFFITQNVNVDVKLLKAVAAACGGQVGRSCCLFGAC